MQLVQSSPLSTQSWAPSYVPRWSIRKRQNGRTALKGQPRHGRHFNAFLSCPMSSRPAACSGSRRPSLDSPLVRGGPSSYWSSRRSFLPSRDSSPRRGTSGSPAEPLAPARGTSVATSYWPPRRRSSPPYSPVVGQPSSAAPVASHVSPRWMECKPRATGGRGWELVHR
jgi:hypothetical protein